MLYVTALNELTSARFVIFNIHTFYVICFYSLMLMDINIVHVDIHVLRVYI